MSRKISAMLGLAVAGSMLAMAASSAHAGPKAYVGNFTDNTVSVIDTSTGSAIATIPVAAGPHGMAISQDGSTVYVAGDGSSSLDVIDTATDRVTKTIDVGKKPNGITLTPDGKLLLVTVIWRRPHRAGRYRDQRRRRNDTSSQASYRIGRAKRQACLCDIAGAWPFRSRRDRSWLAQRRADRTARQNAARRRIWR